MPSGTDPGSATFFESNLKADDLSAVRKFGKPAFVLTAIVIVAIGAIFVSNLDQRESPANTVPSSSEASSIEVAPSPALPSETIGEANAIRKAEVYLSLGGFSKKGLLEQLKFEGYSAAEATYAVENVLVDWDEQAAMKAETYMSVQPFSKSGLIDQLRFEGFTDSQAAYGASTVGF